MKNGSMIPANIIRMIPPVSIPHLCICSTFSGRLPAAFHKILERNGGYLPGEEGKFTCCVKKRIMLCLPLAAVDIYRAHGKVPCTCMQHGHNMHEVWPIYLTAASTVSSAATLRRLTTCPFTTSFCKDGCIAGRKRNLKSILVGTCSRSLEDQIK